MKKRTIDHSIGVWLKLIMMLSLLVSAPVLAADKQTSEQNKSNGVKAGIEKAKAKISGMMTGAPKQSPSPVAVKVNAQNEKNLIKLKNGYTLHGEITDRDANGVWVKIDDGGKIYVTNQELVQS